MLINTVILFLRELLPLCLLLAYLLALQPRVFDNKVYTFGLLAASLMVPFGFFLMAEGLSEAFDGLGAEIVGIFLLLLFCICSHIGGLLTTSSNVRASMLALGTICFVSYKGSSLILYLDIYSSQAVTLQALLMGCLVGLGICASVLVLFRFLLVELISHQMKKFVLAFFLLFVAGNSAEIANLLLQINAIAWGAYPVVDLSSWVQDSSEYGHLLSAMVGYDASPTALYISLYCASVLFGLLIIFVNCRFGQKGSPNPSAVEAAQHTRENLL